MRGNVKSYNIWGVQRAPRPRPNKVDCCDEMWGVLQYDGLCILQCVEYSQTQTHVA